MTRRSCSGTTAAWWPWRPRAPTGTAASSWCAWTSARPSTATASPSDGWCQDCWYASGCVALVLVHTVRSWCSAGVLLSWSSFVGWEGRFEYVAVPRAVPLQGQCRAHRLHVVAHGCCPSPAPFAPISPLVRCLIASLGTSRRTLCGCMLPSVGMPRPSWTAGCCLHRTAHPSCPLPASPGLLSPPPLCTGRRNLRPFRVRGCTG